MIMILEVKPLASLFASDPRPLMDNSQEYNPDIQRDPGWQQRANGTDTYRGDTEDHDK